MSIAQLKKLTFCGLLREKSTVLHALQETGGCHLIQLNNENKMAPERDVRLTEKTLSALKYLNSCSKKRHQVLTTNDFDLERIVKTTLDLQLEIRNLMDERDAISKRIKEIEPWGNFELPDKSQIGGLNLWFYIIPHRLIKKLPTEGLAWQVVHHDNLRCYVVVIDKDEPLPTSMPVPRTHTGSRSLDTLKNRHNYLELQLEDKQADRESLTRWISLLTLQLAKLEDQSVLAASHNLTLDKSGVFMIQAWADACEISKFETFALQHQLALWIADPGINDNPPTLLKNNSIVAGAADLLSFYQMPNYYSWDPSAIIFWSVAVFFSMILSDAGYAALLSIYLAFKWRRIKPGIVREMRMLMVVTLALSMLWGVLIGSYFGYIAPPKSFMGRFKFLDIQDFDSMMLLSIVVGVVHLTLSNLVMAYQRRGNPTAYASLGWAAVTLGGFGLWQARINHLTMLQQGSSCFMVLGILAILCCSGQESISKPSDAVKRLLEGLHGLTEITKIFGNTLSYMRLFALGLAGASLALTFNDLAEEIYHSLRGLGLLCSILILLFGHGLNIVLGLVNGALHGLRLNFIEFFNWSLTEEGYPFKAFSKKDQSQK